MLLNETQNPIVIAGPCAAESWELVQTVAQHLDRLSRELGFDYIFKASFDKANRTSLKGTRGPGLVTAKTWFQNLKDQFGVKILTDVHETYQVAEVAEVCDVLQIPAFLCRQTDLVIAAAASGCSVNIKKGQFMAPGAMSHIIQKARSALPSPPRGPNKIPANIYLTERGTTFGYGNLVVDMRAFPIMAATKAPLILDITHSTQLPAGGEGGETSSAQRIMAPTLARAATATGYLSGYFMEVHTDPPNAVSDRDAQLTLAQAEILLRQLVPLWHQCRNLALIDKEFQS